MSEKTCGGCKVAKSLDCFTAHTMSKDGLRSKCRDCISVISRAWNKANAKRKIAKTRAWQKANPDREAAKNVARRLSDPEKYKSRFAVRNAIHAGKLIRPEHCEACHSQCKPQAHHWSYLREHWLDVIFLCEPCHVETHKTLKALNLEKAAMTPAAIGEQP